MAEHTCPTCNGTKTITETLVYRQPSQVEEERLKAEGKKVPEPTMVEVVRKRNCVRCGGTGVIVLGEA